MVPASVHVGDVFPTKDGDITVEKYVSAVEVYIRFNLTGFKTVSSVGNIKKGCVKDPYIPTVFGAGYLGLGKHKANSRRTRSTAYICWHNMIKRCYSKEYQAKNPWYAACSVSEEWKNFQNFADWYYEHYVDGYELDKDIKVFGNKVYSKETCMFVPPNINRSHKTSYTLRTRGKNKGTSQVPRVAQ